MVFGADVPVVPFLAGDALASTCMVSTHGASMLDYEPGELLAPVLKQSYQYSDIFVGEAWRASAV